MTEALYSAHNRTLIELAWDTPGGAIDQWPHLFAFVSALAEHAKFLGNCVGTLELALGSLDDPDLESWPIVAGSSVEGLHSRIVSTTPLARPLEATFSCEPVIFLPDDHVTVTDFDSVELSSLGEVRLSPVSDLASPHGLTPWRIISGPQQARSMSMLTFNVSFGSPAFATRVYAYARSNCDLWLPTRLDGEPNQPHGDANARLLAECLQQIASSTRAHFTYMLRRSVPSYSMIVKAIATRLAITASANAITSTLTTKRRPPDIVSYACPSSRSDLPVRTWIAPINVVNSGTTAGTPQILEYVDLRVVIPFIARSVTCGRMTPSWLKAISARNTTAPMAMPTTINRSPRRRVREAPSCATAPASLARSEGISGPYTILLTSAAHVGRTTGRL